jgi:hypothetical protein
MTVIKINRRFVALAAGVAIGALVSPALAATCQIENKTKYTFTITSGNVSNQRVGAHTATHINPGKIVGKSDDGKGIGGFCKDGDKLVIKEEKGVPVLLPR